MSNTVDKLAVLNLLEATGIMNIDDRKGIMCSFYPFTLATEGTAL